MYILFELNDSRCTNPTFGYYDAMGYAKTEEAAREWVDQNVGYRRYKYCPDKEFKSE